MPKITPFLWFDTQAEEAANFYCSVFPNSKIGKIARYGKGGTGLEGSVMTVSFSLDGQEFTTLNAGPIFKFTEAVSFVISCKDQNEIDNYWSRLTANGGQENMVRLAQGQVRPNLASHLRQAQRTPVRSRPTKIQVRRPSHASDEKTRHRYARTRPPRQMTSTQLLPGHDFTTPLVPRRRSTSFLPNELPCFCPKKTPEVTVTGLSRRDFLVEFLPD